MLYDENKLEQSLQDKNYDYLFKEAYKMIRDFYYKRKNLLDFINIDDYIGSVVEEIWVKIEKYKRKEKVEKIIYQSCRDIVSDFVKKNKRRIELRKKKKYWPLEVYDEEFLGINKEEDY